MKVFKVIAIFLIVLGIAMIATGGFSFKHKEKVLDTNTIDISVKETKTVTWPWFAGGIAVIGGVALLLIAGKRNSSSTNRSSQGG